MKILRWFISAAISSGIFSILFVVVDAGTLISALLGGAAFAGGALLFAPEKIDPAFAAAAKDIGIDPKQIKSIISGGKKKIKIMKGFILAQNLINNILHDHFYQIKNSINHLFIFTLFLPKVISSTSIISLTR